GGTEEVMAHESLKQRFESFGWHVIEVENGNDSDALNEAFEQAKEIKGRPTAVLAYTVKGCGSSIMENQVSWHHHVPSAEEYAQIMKDFEARKEAARHE
ncbi:MAG: transketolase, partial [Lachnospiraceae bacterium]|nr:transketolase [Lachnospiraceae bacterium]